MCDCQLDKQELDDFERKNENTEINEGGELINRDVELEIETPNGDNLNMEEEDKEEYEDGEEKEGEESDEEDVDEEDWEDEEDVSFHVEEPVDNSLAARLQRTPVTDIRTALGINDKMMIINDLFGGSFDRYSKSINALNEFPTLSGAKVYMSELQIELQWDTESQAYKMLNDLVERRFL